MPSPPKCDNSAVPSDFPQMCGAGYGNDNTMCKYTGIGDKCQNKVCSHGNLSQEDKDEIVNKHNELRRRIAKGQESLGFGGSQPPAADMEKLSWDDELAMTAQRWADQCIWEHDKVRTSESFDSVGQNMYKKMNGNKPNIEIDFGVPVQAWYDEVKDFDPSKYNGFTSNKPPHNGVIGHYTQVVWAKTKKVGCGFIQYDDNGLYTEVSTYRYKMLVCAIFMTQTLFSLLFAIMPPLAIMLANHCTLRAKLDPCVPIVMTMDFVYKLFFIKTLLL